MEKVLLYFVMCLTDLALISGCVYMIEWRGWSVWWVVPISILVLTNNPYRPKEVQ